MLGLSFFDWPPSFELSLLGMYLQNEQMKGKDGDVLNLRLAPYPLFLGILYFLLWGFPKLVSQGLPVSTWNTLIWMRCLLEVLSGIMWLKRDTVIPSVLLQDLQWRLPNLVCVQRVLRESNKKEYRTPESRLGPKGKSKVVHGNEM